MGRLLAEPRERVTATRPRKGVGATLLDEAFRSGLLGTGKIRIHSIWKADLVAIAPSKDSLSDFTVKNNELAATGGAQA